jgi:hypothetical protein
MDEWGQEDFASGIENERMRYADATWLWGGVGMPYPRYTDIACSVKTIDWLEAEILGSIASLYRSLARADEDPRVADLANAIIGCYLLAKRLGISYAELDEQINGNIRENIESGHEIERWYGDFSALANHRKGRSI